MDKSSQFDYICLMSETITTTEANRRFPELMRQVGQGKSFVVTSHGRSIARITPMLVDPVEREAARKALMEHLARQKPTPIEPWTRAELYED